MSANQQLLQVIEENDPFNSNNAELAQLRLAATQERFEDLRARIGVLNRRANDAGVDGIRTREDTVPLLFSHTTYKSYPDTFIRQGRWDRMTQWLTTLSSVEGATPDLEGVADVDMWLDRMADAGHFVVASSGTSGKSSFMDQNADDIELIGYIPHRLLGWPNQIPLDRSRVVVSLNRSTKGRYKGFYQHTARSRYFAKPGGEHNIDAVVPLEEMSRLAALRSKLADGSATPSDVQAFERLRGAGEQRTIESLERLARIVIEKHDQPMVVSGLWPFAYQLVEAARRLGVEAGDLHPDTILGLGGGTKGVALPPDYREQVLAWFAPARQHDMYGMSEMSGYALMCDAGVFHWPSWMELFILDESGEKLLPSTGRVSGRLGLFDPVYSGRWGGIITGDKVTADFGPCKCGRTGPTIEDTITRYGAGSAAGDDKLTCAGTVDAYVREAIR